LLGRKKEKKVKRRGTYTDDMGSTGFSGKHREDASATPDVEHGLAFEKMEIVHDGGAIRAGANGVLEHLLVDTL